MSVQSPVPKDSPLWLAWSAYRATEEYENSKRWASHGEHVEGSLWAAFKEGFRRSSLPTAPGAMYHGGAPGLAIGAALHLPAHLTESLAIATFYAATCPDGWVYEVVARGDCLRDPAFDDSVPCFVAHDAAIITRIVRRTRFSDIEALCAADPAAVSRPEGADAD